MRKKEEGHLLLLNGFSVLPRGILNAIHRGLEGSICRVGRGRMELQVMVRKHVPVSAKWLSPPHLLNMQHSPRRCSTSPNYYRNLESSIYSV